MAALQSPQELKSLTSLHFFAAMMIILYHLREYSALPWLYPISEALFHGVSSFFILSGFALSHAYFDCPAFSWRKFHIARLARLCPTHFAAIALLLAARPLAAARGQSLSVGMTILSFAAGLTLPDARLPVRGVLQSWNKVSWSISTEMAFYAASLFLLAGMRCKWAVPLALSALAVVGICGVGMTLSRPPYDGDRMTATLFNLGSCNPLARGFEFVLGMATCRSWRERVSALKPSAAAWTALAGAVLTSLAVGLGGAVLAASQSLDGPVFVWFHVARSRLVVALPIATLAGGRGWIGAPLSQPLLMWLGEVSFAFSMVHLIVQRALSLRFGRNPSEIAAFANSLALAAILHAGAVSPVHMARRDALHRPRAIPAAAPLFA